MVDYDSSDDEMATRFEGIRSNDGGVIAAESNSTGGVGGGLPNTGSQNHNDDSSTYFCIALQPATAAAAIAAPELPVVEQQQQQAYAATARKGQRPTTTKASSSTRKRRHSPCQQDDNNDNNGGTTKHSAKEPLASAAKQPLQLENSNTTTTTDHHRDDQEVEQTKDETNQNNSSNNSSSSNNTTRIRRRPSTTTLCSKCGRFNFATATGARRHEAACDGGTTQNPKGPWKCPTCGRDSFLTSQAFGGHYRCCHRVQRRPGGEGNGGGVVMMTPTCLSLGRGYHDNNNDDDSSTCSTSPMEVARLKLSNFNKLVLECIELFEASQSDVNVQVTANGKRHISVGNVGIRCVHCARNDTLPVGSTTYTSDLKTLPHAMYVMVQRHLLATCAHIDDDMKRQLRETKKNSTSQSMTKGNIGLPAYLRLLAEKCGLTDDDKKLGVRYIASTTMTRVTTEASPAAVREGGISATTVAAPAAASEGGASAGPNHSLGTTLEMEHRQLPGGETRPNHQDYYDPHLSSFLEDVLEEVEI